MSAKSFRVYTMVSGRVMELTVDFEAKKRLIRRGILETDLKFDGPAKRDFRVGRTLFYQIMSAANDFSMEVVDGVPKEESGFVVPKAAVWAALRQELDEGKMETIAYFDKGEYEEDDYYDYGVLLRGFQRYCNGEISGQYFAEWCYVCNYCFKHMRGVKGGRILGAYSELGDFFDTLSYMNRPNNKAEYEAWRKEQLARLRYCNFVIECAKNNQCANFTTNGVATFVTFGCYSEGGNKPITHALVVDYELKKFNCFYLPDFIYDEGVNYSFLGAEEFDKKLHAQINFKMDGRIRIDYAKKKGEKK